LPLAVALADFQSRVAQCDSLIANAHKADAAGDLLFSPVDREQITVAAFLNLFIAWEGFIEDAMTRLMSGSPTISGAHPTRHVTPPTQTAAKAMVIGINRFFDYANHDNVRKVVSMYFDHGYPFEPHISAIASTLSDLRTMRNASAHVTSTTQHALEALAQRIFVTPRPGITLYALLVAVDPRSATGGTVFAESRDCLLAATALIANG
jgi:hypothetical protein